MPLVSCNFAGVLYDRMVPLATNQVPVPGLSINFINVSQPREIFDRTTGSQEFDASELSASEHIVRHISGDQDFVAIPVFPLRSFRHRDIYINTDRISKASDLNGKRVGVPLYTMTAAVWIRGLLQHEYGVDLSTIDWTEGSMEKPGLRGNNPSVLPPLSPVRVSPNKDPRRGLSALWRARCHHRRTHSFVSRQFSSATSPAPLPRFSRRRDSLLPTHGNLPHHARRRASSWVL
jgi:4,5-dihydroxyphthalate decarboxylase